MPRCREIMLNWFRDQLLPPARPTKNINTVAPFLHATPYLYEETRTASCACRISTSGRNGRVDGLPRTEENGFQHIVLQLGESHSSCWDDTLMMSVLPLAKIGRLLEPPALRGRSARASSCCTPSTWSIARPDCGSTAGPFDWPALLRRRVVAPRQLLGDDARFRNSSSCSICHAAMACVSSCSKPTCNRSARSCEHQDAGGLLAHAHRRSDVLSRKRPPPPASRYGILKSGAARAHRR